MQISAIHAQRDQLLQSGGRQMRRALFGNAGYGLDVNGTEENVSGLTVQDVKAQYGLLLAPTNCVVSIFGDVKADDVRQAIEDAGKRIRKAGKVAGILAPVEADARHWIEQGFAFVAVGGDAALLARQSEELAAKFKRISG